MLAIRGLEAANVVENKSRIDNPPRENDAGLRNLRSRSVNKLTTKVGYRDKLASYKIMATWTGLH